MILTYASLELINLIQPSFAILYNPSIYCIRMLEVYSCTYPGKLKAAYEMVYKDSIDLEKYKSSVNRERVNS